MTTSRIHLLGPLLNLLLVVALLLPSRASYAQEADAEVPATEYAEPESDEVPEADPATNDASVSAAAVQAGEVFENFDTPQAVDSLTNGIQAALSNGSVSYSYPIQVPPGAGGLIPNLALTYSSQAGYSSLLGHGWNITRHYIERDSRDYHSTGMKTNLVLNGASHRLIHQGDLTYRTQIESHLSVTLELHGGTGLNGNHWIVYDTSGTKYTFGKTVITADQCHGIGTHVGRWYLDEATDIHGNTITYNYVANPNGEHNATYPSSITYNNGQHVIEFAYESSVRPDYKPQASAWCLYDHNRRLERINVKTNGSLVRAYQISYGQIGYASVVTSLTQLGADGTSSLPPVTFDWYPEATGFESQGIWRASGPHLTDSGTKISEANHDGLIDLIQSKDESGVRNLYYFRNDSSTWVGDTTGTGKTKLYSNIPNFSNKTTLADLTGDMQPDFVEVENGGWKIWFQDGQDPVVWSTEGVNLYDDYVFVLDVNGDGKADYLKSDPSQNHKWLVRVNTGSGFASAGEWYGTGIPGHAASRRVDYNGDGLIDLLFEGNSDPPQWEIYYNYGDRVRTSAGHTSGTGQADTLSAPFTLNNEAVQIVDVTGDGFSDLVFRDGLGAQAQIRVYKGHPGGWESTYTTWLTGVELGNGALMDVDGDGLADVMLSHGANLNHRWDLYRNNGYAPLKLKTLTNGAGGVTEITYDPSTKYATPDMPGTNWLVSVIETHGFPNAPVGDPRAVNTSTTYTYEGGKFDFAAREFLGFHKVTQTESDGTRTVTVFYQDLGRKSKPNNQWTYDGPSDTQVLSLQQTAWSVSESGGVYTTNLSRTDTREYNGDHTSFRTIRTEYEYDSYGNVTRQANLGYLDVAGDETYVHTSYNYNPSLNLLNTPERLELRGVGDNPANPLSISRTYYDGNGLGVAPTKGLPTKSEVWLDTTGTYLATTMSYDSYGNLLTQTDAESRTTTNDYDATGTFVISTTNALNHTATSSYDPGTGNLVSQTDPNGYVTTYTYDTFGRPLTEVRPYDSSSYPSVEYIYENDGTVPEHITTKVRLSHNQAGTIDSVIGFDGFGRTLQTRTPGDNGQQILVDLTYDNQGRDKTQSNPYYAAPSTLTTAHDLSVPKMTIAYDGLSRMILQTLPDGNTRSMTYYRGRTEETNERGYTTARETNGLGQTTDVYQDTSGFNWHTTYLYDGRGQLTSVTDPIGVTLSFTYDSLGRVTQEIDPNRGTKTFTYDAVGNIKEVKDGSGSILVTNTYDALHRQIAADYPGTVDDTTMIYDRETKGTLSEESNGNATITYLYDNQYRVTTKTLQSEARTVETTYTYDAQGNLLTQSHTGGQSITYQYVSGMLEAIVGIISNIDYSPFSLPQTLANANGLTANWTFESDTGRVETHTLGSELSFTYDYDPNGNVKQIDEPDYTFDYTYDALDRLITGIESQAGLYDVTYTYDAGYRIVQVAHDHGTIMYTYNTAQPHAVDQTDGPLIQHNFSTEPIPDAAPLISPLGEITQTTPTFTWGKVDHAVGYTLVVYDVANAQIIAQQDFQSAVCTGNTCTAQVAGLNLASGSYTWLIRAYNSDGLGNWSMYSPSQ